MHADTSSVTFPWSNLLGVNILHHVDEREQVSIKGPRRIYYCVTVVILYVLCIRKNLYV